MELLQGQGEQDKTTKSEVLLSWLCIESEIGNEGGEEKERNGYQFIYSRCCSLVVDMEFLTCPI